LVLSSNSLTLGEVLHALHEKPSATDRSVERAGNGR
jgi:hypothetical protein